MIDTSSRSQNEVTVILLGHAQADHRDRTLHYLAQAAVPSLALEGDAQQALPALLSQVVTPFVALALDADFILPSALSNAAQCLHTQPQAVAAQGYALAYAPGNGQVAYHKVGSAFEPLQGTQVQDRLRQYALAGQQAWRAVLRVATLRTALASLPSPLTGADFRLALSYAIIAQGEIAHLHQTDVICEAVPCSLGEAAQEERLVQAVHRLRQWDAQQFQACGDDSGFAQLNRFVRETYAPSEAPLLFTSHWRSVIDDPERVFEPSQFVELPYYNAELFARMSALEFICHAWPTGERHRHAMEGVWVRQRELVQEQPNDTAESLLDRYWQAMALGLFNIDVCQRLANVLTPDGDGERDRELRAWLLRLQQVPGIETRALLDSTPSGKLLAAIAQATPDATQRQRVFEHLRQHPGGQVAFVVLDLENDNQALQSTFDSLLAAGVTNFKLVVLKAGKPPTITTARDTLHFVQVSQSNWVSHLNQVVRQLPSEWLLLLQAGDVLLPGGLLRLQVELAQAPACLAIAADEVQRDEKGRLLAVRRPGSDLDLLRSQPGLMSRHWLMSRQAVVDLGGYGESHRHAAEYELLLRLVEQQGPGVLAHMDDFLVVCEQPAPALSSEASTILSRHLTQLGYRAQISDQGAAGLAIDFRHSATPLVSVVLAYEGDAQQLQACLTGIFQRTRYPRYEVLVAVAGGSETAAQGVPAAFANRVRLLAGEPGDSRESLLDLAAGHARGDYLVVLSERTQVLTPAWIEALLNEAQRPEVGVVGAGLWAADGTLAHAGYELLAGPVVQVAWQGVSPEDAESVRWPLSVRSCAAVSGDCLMVRKDVFEHCGRMQVAQGGDIDLCLAALDAGLLVVWTPRSQLLVSATQGVDAQAGVALAERWPAAFQRQVQGEGLAWLP